MSRGCHRDSSPVLGGSVPDGQVTSLQPIDNSRDGGLRKVDRPGKIPDVDDIVPGDLFENQKLWSSQSVPLGEIARVQVNRADDTP